MFKYSPELRMIYLLLILATPVLSGISLSLSDLGDALKTEIHVINTLDEFLVGKTSNADVKNVKKYVDNFKNLAYNMTKDFEDPLQAYLVVKHLTDDFEALKNSISDRKLKDVIRTIKEMRHTGKYPTAKDLDSTAESLVRLQQIYEIKINDVSSNKKLNHALGLFDFVRLAGQSLLTMDVSLAIDWFEIAIKSLSQETNLLPKQAIDTIKQQFETVKTTVGTNFESFRQQIKSIPDFMIDALALQFPGIPVEIIKKFKSTIENVGEQKIDPTFKKLCRNKKLTNDVLDEDKICVMMKRSLRDTISPYKAEILSVDPVVFIVHDLLPNSLSDYFKQLSLSEFENSNRLNLDYMKNSRVLNFEETSDERLAKVTKEITRLSGLKLQKESQYMVKILNFGIGGYEDYDSLKQSKKSKSPRLTVDVFLNEVGENGRTVFPGLRLGIETLKNSALFTYHSRNRRVNPDSFSASCPVKSGSKWILRKEIH